MAILWLKICQIKMDMNEMGIASYSLNWLLSVLQKPLECYIIGSGYALANYVRFLQQHRILDSKYLHSNLYL